LRDAILDLTANYQIQANRDATLHPGFLRLPDAV
jgi:hypothetical protein